ncbi:MAG: transketolase C-terminal domain-containing protein [Byssovorax sp.]
MSATTYEDLLLEIAEKNDNLIVMTAENRAAIRNLPPKLGKRFIDVGIAEQTMIGAAAGLALRGRVPVAHALATFLTLRAFEFIRDDVGIPGLPVKLVGAVPGFLSDGNGATHQAIEDISLMRGIPSMNVFCPADEQELLAGMPSVIASPNPFYVRYCALKPSVTHTEPFAIGKAEVLSRGKDVAILTYGFLLREAAVAKQLLEDAGLSVRLVNLRTVKPIDEQAVLESIAQTKLTVTVEDHFLTGGLFSIVAELCLTRGVSGRVFPMALRDRWFTPGLLQSVLEHEGFTGAQIAATIKKELSR